MKTITKSLISVAVGIVIGASAVGYLTLSGSVDKSSGETAKEPLYWVAPMDSNYRRDKPGQSPMGMDLVPVYEDGTGSESAGTIKIDPDVVNNLGVTTAPVTLSKLSLEIETVGYVKYDEDKVVTVSPRIEGWIERLFVKAVGDPVLEGEPLYSIYSPTLVNAQEELLLSMQRGNPVLINAAEERLRALQVSDEVIKRLKQTREINRTIIVKAQQSGVLDKLTIREGAHVNPNMNLMAIAQPNEIWVIAEVFERQLNQVEIGNNVRMTLEYAPGKQWEGQVDYVYPSLNSETRTGQVRIHIDNPNGFLKPGMFADLDIDSGFGDENLIIPKDALIRMGDLNRVVLALGDGKFKSVNVGVGRLGSSKVEILYGLKEGDEIVTSAQFLIDSESSKTSDFRRMNHDPTGDMKTDKEMNMAEGMTSEGTAPQKVWVEASVKSVSDKQSMVTLKHAEIPDWDWPAMTMDFSVASDVDMTKLSPGLLIHVEITKTKNQSYQISEVHLAGSDSMKTKEHNHD